MKELEFTSQICTTREQSQKLLSLDLKPETADMVYHFTNSRAEAMQWELKTKPPTLRGEFWTEERITLLARRGESGDEVFDRILGKDVPAWSLSRLLGLMPTYIELPNMPSADLDINTDGQYWFVSYDEMGYYLKHQEMKPDLYEAVISMIEWLIKNKFFNKDYLQ